MGFIGRDLELEYLRNEFQAERPSLVIVYGRRRVGKSTLLQQASEKTGPYIYFQATQVDEALNLREFKQEISRTLRGDDPILGSISDWLGALHYLANKAREHPKLVVIIDEFPYLLTSSASAVPSIFQKFWDSRAAKGSSVKLVLCGSLISQMQSLLAEKNPLYGRKTLSFELPPMPLRDTAKFLPNYKPADQIVAHSVFGGVPYYLEACRPDLSIQENMKNLLLSPTGLLHDEPELLLQTELKDTQRYSSIIWAVANGATKPSEIVGRIQSTEIKNGDALGPYIEKLTRMGIIAATRPIGSAEASRNRRYAVVDPLFRFWHRFVLPDLSLVNRGFGDQVMASSVMPHLSEYMGLAFERICRDHMLLHAQDRLGAPAREVGSIWSGDYDIDVAGSLIDGASMFGECKWTTAKVDDAILARLIERADRCGYMPDAARHYLLFSRKGFSDGLKSKASLDGSLNLVSIEELVDAKELTHDDRLSRDERPASKNGP